MGLEPTTIRLTAVGSTFELFALVGVRVPREILKGEVINSFFFSLPWNTYIIAYNERFVNRFLGFFLFFFASWKEREKFVEVKLGRKTARGDQVRAAACSTKKMSTKVGAHLKSRVKKLSAQFDSNQTVFIQEITSHRTKPQQARFPIIFARVIAIAPSVADGDSSQKSLNIFITSFLLTSFK